MEEKELIKAEETAVSPEVWSCLNCGATVPSTQDYCNKCGAYKPKPIEETEDKKYCKQCGNALYPQAAICPKCGSKAPSVTKTSHPLTTPDKPKKNSPKIIYYSECFSHSWLFTFLSLLLTVLAVIGWLSSSSLESLYFSIAELVINRTPRLADYTTAEFIARITPLIVCLIAHIISIIPKIRFEASFFENNTELHESDKAEYEKRYKEKYKEMTSDTELRKMLTPLTGASLAILLFLAVVITVGTIL